MSAGSLMGRLIERNAFRGSPDIVGGTRNVIRLTAGMTVAALLAGCSSDVSRLATGPFGAVDHTPTASIGSRDASLVPPQSVNAGGGSFGGSGGYAPSIPVRSAPLAPIGAVQSAPLAPPQNAWQPPAAAISAPALPTRPNFGTPIIAKPAIAKPAIAKPAISTPAIAAPALARSVAPAFTPVAGSVGPWSAAGGSPVTVGQGESVAALSSRYGVPPDTLLKINGLTSASQVTPGSRLVIPVYNATAPAATATAAASAAALAPAKAAAAKTAATQTVAARTSALANQTSTAQTSAAQTAAAAKLAPVKAAAASATPAKALAAVDPKLAQQTKAATDKAALAAKKIEDAKAAKTKAAEDAAAAAKRTKVAAASAAEAVETTASAPADAKPEFRWPARGRIIQGFRSGSNDGINIAVPEGTSVKAAESGVVAYAGSELKGYGNLVLIRHPNGFVSAYAHNGEVSVKRGETVKRGQTIAKSGQSGNVASPQLHFELRKGSTPVDPTGYLAGL